MARTSGRSYLTYRQIVVCAFVDLEREENGGVGRAFHKNSLHAKIRHLARAENFNLGEYWTRRVAKAVNKLLDEGVLRKATRNAFIGLSPKGRKRLVTSHERYGPLEKLSPFKKSQFLKNIATTSVIKTPRSCAVSESNLENANILKKYNSQQEEIKSLRAVLRDTQRELEDTKMDRDDLELELRDLARPLFTPNASDTMVDENTNPEPTLKFAPTAISTPHHSRTELIVLSDSNSSPALFLTRPTPTPGSLPPTRPMPKFAHRASGSFLNTLSNQYTPSPSPGPPTVTGIFNGVSRDDTLNHPSEENSDDDNDFGPADSDDHADMNEVEDGLQERPTADKRMELDSTEIQSEEPTLLEALARIVGLEVKLAVAEGAAATMMQERNATEQEKTVLGAQLESVIQRCDELDRAKIQLEEDLRDHQQQVTGLRATLLVTMQGREDFQSTNHALQTRLTCIDEARISAASDNVRLIGDLAQRTDEATALNDEILALAMHLAKSNEERDRERAQGVQLAAQLTATVHQLQNTQAFLGVTDAQLRGIQGDLCTVWNQLQESNKDLDVTRRQLNETCSELSKTQICLNEADLNLRSTNAELQNSGRLFNMTNAQLQTTRADLESARQALRVVETQHETTKAVLSTKDRELENAKTVSNSIRAEMQDATDRAAARERALQNKVQEVEDERDQAKEAQAHIRAVWAAGEEQRRAAAEAEERLRHALFPGPATRRDPSFRDSGVSFTL